MTNRLFIAVAMPCAIACIGASSASSQPPAFNVSVIYWPRPCGVPVGATLATPVTAGTLLLTRNGQPAGPITLSTNAAQTTLGGTGPIEATLILETPRISVVEGHGNGGPQRLKLADASVDNGGVTFNVPRDDTVGNGHVNVLIQLERAADVAAQASPMNLPQVTARVYNGDVGSRPGLKFEPATTIHVGRAGAVDADWEPDALAHEYGHFVLTTIAHDGPDNGDDHDIAVSYRDRPNLAWSEGFAAAFAAVANPDGGGQINKNCEPYQNLATAPARPARVSKETIRFSQYNETRVGAVTYQLIGYLGKGVTGLKALLDALTQYQRDGHSAWTTRDLRDLAVQQFEKSAADHVAIDQIFMGQGISWEQSFSLSMGPNTEVARSANSEIAVSVTGPGGFDCRVTSDVNRTRNNRTTSILDRGNSVWGIKAASGGMSYSANDDCYLVSGDGVLDDRKGPHDMGDDAVTMPFPYLAGLDHWKDWFKVRAKYVCKFDTRFGPKNEFYCPSKITLHSVIGNPSVLQFDPPGMTTVPITLELNRDKVIARFRAQGDCEIGDNFTDCGF